MSESLFHYYERELTFIRQLSQEFARQYPAAASRLRLEPNIAVDPHVERLIESFALLTGRIQHKIDDEFPELTDALLSVLYPHYLAPVPSMAMVQFELDPGRVELPNGFVIPRASKLFTQPVDGAPCKYRTGYPVTLWPVELIAAQLLSPPFPSSLQAPARAAGALRLHLECQADMRFSGLSLDRLRFFLSGENQIIANLYEILFNQVSSVVFRPLDQAPGAQPFSMTPAQCLFQVGFAREDSLLPYPHRSFLGYRLLTELFSFPTKFFFLDLGGFRYAQRMGYQKKLEVVLFLNRTLTTLEQAVNAQTFRLGCTPVINLFEQTAEPIALTQARYEYRIVPDVTQPNGTEVYSVDEVVSVDPISGTTTEYQPFYSFRHGATLANVKTFWHASRRATIAEGDRGTDVYINLVDLGFSPHLPAESTIVVRTTCTNRDLPVKLQRAIEHIHFELEAAAPISRIRCLRSPTSPLRPPLRRGGYWRLISHLALNHLSISDPVEGREALQEILKLYDFSDPQSQQQLAAVNQQLVEGILGISHRRVVGRTGVEISSGFCRGLEITLELDEQKYVGTGVFLFASVLERFFSLYASINSFTQLVLKTKQGEGILKKWLPRAADLQLL